MTSAIERTAGRCPITHGFKPFSEGYRADPYPFFKLLRDEMPIAYAPNYDLYLVTRSADIAAVLKNRDAFSAANATKPFTKLGATAQAIMTAGLGDRPTFTITSTDPPFHTAVRAMAMKCLTRHRWTSVQPTITSFLDDRLARIRGRETIDLAADLVFPTTAFAGFSLLGFDPADTELLTGWCGDRVLMSYGELTEDAQVVAAEQVVSFWRYVKAHVRKRQQAPTDDLTSDIIAASQHTKGLVTIEDVDNVIYALALASHETTANAILNGVHCLMREHHAWTALVRDPSLISHAVDELLRLVPPTVTHRRLCKRDTEIGGVTIPAGATVMLVLASGNRDPAHFPSPDTLDLCRENASEHFTFGKNWHFCLGAPLARFEYGLFLERLTTVMPGMTLATDKPLDYLPVVLFRAPKRLLVRPGAGGKLIHHDR